MSSNLGLKPDRNYVVSGRLLIALDDLTCILNKLNYKDKEKFDNDRLLYNLGYIKGIFESECVYVHEEE